MLIITREPTGNTYYKLINLAQSSCTWFLVVQRKDIGLSKTASRLFKDLEPHLIECKEQQSWPGTEIKEFALVYYYRFTKAAANILKKYSTGLYSWVQPDLPEDLCFLRDRNTPWLINTAHEGWSGIDNEKGDDADKLLLIDGMELQKI